MKNLEIKFAEKCAWRAFYVYVRDRQVAHLGIDPTADRGARVFGRLFRFSFRLRVPFTVWRFNQPRLVTRWQQFIHSLDGRF